MSDQDCACRERPIPSAPDDATTSLDTSLEGAPANSLTGFKSRHFGWLVVAAGWLLLVFVASFIFYSLPVYVDALQDAHGFSLTTVSTATSFFYLVNAVLGVGVGWLVGRVDVRWVVGGAAVLTSLGFVLLGTLSSTWQLYAAYALIGTGFAGGGLIAVTTVILRWFVIRRSLAITLTTCGLPIGGLVGTPIIASFIERDGISAVAPWMGLIYVAVSLPMAVLFLRPDPASMGMTADDGSTSAGHRAASSPSSPGSARSGRFVTLCLAMLLFQAAVGGAVTHLYTLGSERDLSATAVAVPMLALMSATGSFLAVPVLARARAVTVVACVATGQIAALAILAVAQNSLLFLLAAALLGLGLAGFTVMAPNVLTELFPAREYPRLYSMLTLVAVLGIAAGPALIGVIHEGTGGYLWPLLLFTVVPLAATVLLLRIRAEAAGSPQSDRPPHRRRG